MKIQLLALFMFALIALVLTSCAGSGLTVTDDGCLMSSTIRDDGSAYQVGICTDAEGQIVAYRTQYTNSDGVTIRITRPVDGPQTIEYRDPDSGAWIGWSQDSGVTVILPGNPVIAPTK